MKKILNSVKIAQKELAKLSANERNELIFRIASKVRENCAKILAANAADLANASDLSSAMKDRLKLDEARLNAICAGLESIAGQKEVIGEIKKGWVAKSGIKINQIAVPIGVIAAIYEARPNVTLEIAALAIKSANGCVLKGGKEARLTNLAFMDALNSAFLPLGFCSVAFLDISRDEVLELLGMSEFIDMIVPRGGENLVRFVSENSRIPVLKHDKGLCHIYIDKAMELQKALNIAINAKCSRPAVCNAAETFLVHESVASNFLSAVYPLLKEYNVEIFGCPKTAKIIECKSASEQNYDTEYDDFKLNIKVVASIDEALAHIARYGSGHSEAIISEDYSACQRFLSEVDASCVFANASTRFNDGGEFGFGAEVGISTNRLHARGPVGVEGLTSYKYIIYGNGEVR